MEEADLIIAGSRVLTMDEKGTIHHDGAIAIRGDKITAVGPRAEILKLYRGTIIEAGDSIVMPGIVNTHTHAAMTCFRGIADDLKLEDWLNNFIFPAEARNVNPELAYWGTMLACAEMIKSGTTAFCDMYIFEDETAQAARDAGMRAVVGEVLFDFPSPNFKTPAEGLAYTRRLIEKWAGDDLISIVVEPHALYTCSPGLLKDAKALADEYGLWTAVHLLETKFERESLVAKLATDPVSFLEETGCLDERFLAFHCVWLNPEDIKKFAAHGCSVSHSPESNMKLASGCAPVPDMLAAGLRVGLGTDGCASNNNLDMLEEMDTAAKLHKVTRLDPTAMPAETAVKMATCDGAAAIGLGGITGALKPGMRADIITIPLDKPHLTPIYSEYSHLVYAARGADVDTAVINGRLVMRGRRLLTIDEEEAMAQVSDIALRVRESLGAK